jgi:hypothetical protein
MITVRRLVPVLVPGDPLGVALEPVGDQVGMQGPSVRPGEHQVVGVGKCDDRSLLGLAPPMLAQRPEGPCGRRPCVRLLLGLE